MRDQNELRRYVGFLGGKSPADGSYLVGKLYDHRTRGDTYEVEATTREESVTVEGFVQFLGEDLTKQTKPLQSGFVTRFKTGNRLGEISYSVRTDPPGSRLGLRFFVMSAQPAAVPPIPRQPLPLSALLIPDPSPPTKRLSRKVAAFTPSFEKLMPTRIRRFASVDWGRQNRKDCLSAIVPQKDAELLLDEVRKALPSGLIALSARLPGIQRSALMA
ncbi:MAG TPA: hypothetical protein VGO93_20715 [Candidatus Xenobia bacterium]